ncbi:unnamed protein product [Prorocentrum cordatum]|uniref:Uncharacterized protein n=1 Tax=Prorocentrum cordatum TaxID=2364126 RepID=A0ABN9Q627_9DINO|nr:unnamed protein product [Polarella glacialis]
MSVGRLATGSGVCFFLKCLLASDIIIEEARRYVKLASDIIQERADTSVLLALDITGARQRSPLTPVSRPTIGRGVCLFPKCERASDIMEKRADTSVLLALGITGAGGDPTLQACSLSSWASAGPPRRSWQR